MNKNTRPIHMLPTRKLHEIQGHTQAKSEGIEKDFPCKWKPKESCESYTCIRQNGLSNRDCNNRQGRPLYNDKMIRQEDITFVIFIQTTQEHIII